MLQQFSSMGIYGSAPKVLGITTGGVLGTFMDEKAYGKEALVGDGLIGIYIC